MSQSGAKKTRVVYDRHFFLGVGILLLRVSYILSVSLHFSEVLFEGASQDLNFILSMSF